MRLSMTETTNTSMNLRMTVYVALFTSLIIIGGYISMPIPVGPVPIVLSDFFVMLTGLFLGYKWGSVSILLFLSMGAIGLPVFQSGTAGWARFVGPTGGYLVGYIIVVLCIGLITEKIKTLPGKTTILKNLVALVISNIILYVIAVSWLKVAANMSWFDALAAGFIPFIAGTVIKIIAVIVIGQVLLPRFKQTIEDNS